MYFVEDFCGYFLCQCYCAMGCQGVALFVTGYYGTIEAVLNIMKPIFIILFEPKTGYVDLIAFVKN